MTILHVCAVKDSAMQAFATPIHVPSLGLAIRSFGDEATREGENNPLSKHPDDFELVYLATYDDETGQFSVAEGGVRVLARAKDFKK